MSACPHGLPDVVDCKLCAGTGGGPPTALLGDPASEVEGDCAGPCCAHWCEEHQTRKCGCATPPPDVPAPVGAGVPRPAVEALLDRQFRAQTMVTVAGSGRGTWEYVIRASQIRDLLAAHPVPDERAGEVSIDVEPGMADRVTIRGTEWARTTLGHWKPLGRGGGYHAWQTVVNLFREHITVTRG